MINLDKGGKVNLDKSMTKAVIKLNWKPQSRVGEDFDLDSSIAMIPEVGCPGDEDYIMSHDYTKHPTGCVVHMGDDKTGAQGEEIHVDLDLVPQKYKKLVFIIEIYKAQSRHQTFGMVSDSVAYVYDANDMSAPSVKCDLGEDFSTETCVVACEIYRNNGGWKVNNVAAGYQAGLKALLEDYGFEVEERKQV
jgi:tellurium resistance protein TerD